MSEQYARKVRQFLERMGSSPASLLMQTSAEQSELLEALGVNPKDRELVKAAQGRLEDGLALTAGQASALEAIVMPFERPAIDILRGTFDPPVGRWENLAAYKDVLKLRIAGVGRVESPLHQPYAGTAFVVGPGLLMTNRHVVRKLVERLVPSETPLSPKGRTQINLRREAGSDESVPVDVERIELIHAYWDMAILRVAGLPDDAKPLPLTALEPTNPDQGEVAVIGYPYWDERNPLDLQTRVFRGLYGYKRLTPGELRGYQQQTSFMRDVDVLCHDASTLGGNSGSAVVHLDSGEVVALHFGGRHLEGNYAVPMWELYRDPRLRGLGLQFTGAPEPKPPDEAVELAWERAAIDDHSESAGACVVIARSEPTEEKLLDAELLYRLHETIQACEVPRDELLMGVPSSFTNKLPRRESSASQLMSDLHAMNSVRPFGGVFPLRLALINIKSIGRLDDQGRRVVDEALRRVGQALDERGMGAALRTSDGRKVDDIRFRALLVGNHEFPRDDSFVGLKGPPNDLQRLQDALTHPQLGLYAPSDVRVLLDADAREINIAVNRFFDAADDDQHLFFYYSGHGVLDVKNRLYLAASDTERDVLAATGVKTSMIRALMDECDAACVIAVLDCCHSGGFKNADSLPDRLAGEGRYILTSSSTTELSRDAEVSPFTLLLVEALLSGEVDADGDGYVSVNEVYDYVRPRLKKLTGQNPQRAFHEGMGDAVVGKARRGEIELPRPARPEPAQRPPKLRLSKTTLDVGAVELGSRPDDAIVEVYNDGDGELDWYSSSDQDWLRSEDFHNFIKLSFFPRPGENRALLTVQDRRDAGSATVEIVARMHQDDPPVLALSAYSVDFGEVRLDGGPVSQAVQAENNGGGRLTIDRVVANPPLSAQLRSERLIMVELSPTNAGPFASVVRVETNGGTAAIAITAVVQAGPVLDLSPAEIDFGSISADRQRVRTVWVRNAGSGQLTWSFRKTGRDFFVVDRVDEKLHLTTSTLLGNHHGTVHIDSNGGSATVQVSAHIEPVPEPPPPQAPPPQLDVAGTWADMINGGGVRFVGSPPTYQFQELNALGMIVGQGVATIMGNLVQVQSNNSMLGAWHCPFQLQPNGALVGHVNVYGAMVSMNLVRQY